MVEDTKAQDILSTILEKAKAAGADAADALMYSSVSSGVSWRLGKLEDIERSEGQDLGLRVIIGNRQACVSTTDLSHKSLSELAQRCYDMASSVPEDPWCGLAPQERLASAPFPDLDLGDFQEPSSQELKDRANACEEAALAVKGISNSNGAGASYGEAQSWLATSHGFFGKNAGSNHSVSVSVVAQDDNGMETDYDYDSQRHISDIREISAIGASAGARTIARLSPRKIKSQTAPVIFDKRVSASLLGHLSGASNGGAIARGVSFLKDKMGEQLFPKGINIIDDPHIKRGLGSRPFDGEGLANKRINLIEDGKLTTWIMNSSQARQLGLESNARAQRGTSSPPEAGTTNLYMEAGTLSLEELIEQADNGLLLTDMFGPQVNSNTGDYSVGCSGFWIENGAVTSPVSEITIAGNLFVMYAGLIPASDLEFKSSTNAPSVLVPPMTIAGAQDD